MNAITWPLVVGGALVVPALPILGIGLIIFGLVIGGSNRADLRYETWLLLSYAGSDTTFQRSCIVIDRRFHTIDDFVAALPPYVRTFIRQAELMIATDSLSAAEAVAHEHCDGRDIYHMLMPGIDILSVPADADIA